MFFRHGKAQFIVMNSETSTVVQSVVFRAIDRYFYKMKSDEWISASLNDNNQIVFIGLSWIDLWFYAAFGGIYGHC